MGRVAIHPSAALADLLKGRREELGLSLREVEQQTEAAGVAIPFTTLAKIEQGRAEPGVRRLHALLRLYNLPLDFAADLLDLEEFAGDLPTETRSPEQVFQEGVEHWKAGRSRQGLAHLFSLRKRSDVARGDRYERQRALLSFAVYAGSMGKYRLAHQIVQDLLLEPPDPDLLVSVLIQAAVCWHWLGSGEAALAFLARAEAHTEDGDSRERAWICHERASTLASLAQNIDAERAIQEALEHYRAAGDAYGEARARAVSVRIASQGGDARRALDEARAARRHAEKHSFDRLRVARMLDEGRAMLECGETVEALEILEEFLVGSVATKDPVLQFYAHHALWRGHEQVGDRLRARFELQAAQYFVRFVDEKTEEAIEVRRTDKTPPRRRR